MTSLWNSNHQVNKRFSDWEKHTLKVVGGRENKEPSC